MTELYVPALLQGNDAFLAPNWNESPLKHVKRRDPLSNFCQRGKQGGVNIIDLANITPEFPLLPPKIWEGFNPTVSF